MKSQDLVDVDVLRGLGGPIEKSILLLFESKQPPRLRRAAVVLLVAPVEPEPSKQLALPYPTKSIKQVGQLPLNGFVVLERATLPAPPAIAIVPMASGIGSGVVPPKPCASCTR